MMGRVMERPKRVANSRVPASVSTPTRIVVVRMVEIGSLSSLTGMVTTSCQLE
ncbi:hypothetical protein D3C76_1799170 [compost metagenome]